MKHRLDPELARPGARVASLRAVARELRDIALVLRAADATGEAGRALALAESVDVVAAVAETKTKGDRP